MKGGGRDDEVIGEIYTKRKKQKSPKEKTYKDNQKSCGDIDAPRRGGGVLVDGKGPQKRKKSRRQGVRKKKNSRDPEIVPGTVKERRRQGHGGKKELRKGRKKTNIRDENS